MEQEEIWRDIEGYEGLYQVSNMGRVKSLGNDKNRKEKILKPGMNNYGYLQVGLHKEGKRKIFQVHRLVAQAFIPNPEELPEINHKTEIKTDNRAEFIEWCDHRYNMNYGTRNERAGKNMVQTKIKKGLADPELCGFTNKKRDSLYYQKNREKINERSRLYYKKNREKWKEYRRRKK